MFGYIRPKKEELTVGEYERYKSIYCGVCKQIKKSFGNFPRTALTYDMTFFALFYIALSKEPGTIQKGPCIMSPIRKNTFVSEHEALEKAAALSVLLAKKKTEDNVKDSRKGIKKIRKICLDRLFYAYYKSAEKLYPKECGVIEKSLLLLNEAENKSGTQCLPPEKYGNIFAATIKGIFEIQFSGLFPEEKNEKIFEESMGILGFNFGKWIYIMDAADDFGNDKKNNEFNAFNRMEHGEMLECAEKILVRTEGEIDRIAALLPYYRDAGIISNIILKGMPQIRKAVLSGKTPEKV